MKGGRALLLFGGRPHSFHGIAVVLLAVLSRPANAQMGSTVCVCSPSTYTMTFNFSRTCDVDGVLGDGIVTTDCAIAPFQNDNVTDLVPVSVGSIDILELDEQLALVTQETRFGTFTDGETFEYTSISNDPSKVNATIFPKALQFSVLGNNADGETLFFAGLVIYGSDCLVFPTIVENSTIGWLTFVSTEDHCCEISLVMTASYWQPLTHFIFTSFRNIIGADRVNSRTRCQKYVRWLEREHQALQQKHQSLDHPPMLPLPFDPTRPRVLGHHLTRTRTRHHHPTQRTRQPKNQRAPEAAPVGRVVRAKRQRAARAVVRAKE